jgi:hypothetical protein
MRVQEKNTHSPVSRWEVMEWQLECNTLERERQHLLQKSQERVLTAWEIKRLACAEIEITLNKVFKTADAGEAQMVGA